MTKAEILQDIIEGYRDSIRERYQYQNIKQHYTIPETINEETVVLLRNFFLDYIYPDFEKRSELDEAFKSLDEYIKRPQSLLRIVLDTSRLIFTYGRHLPKVLHTGLKALKSFRAAAKFENSFVEEAIKNQMEPPYDVQKINRLINLLPREEIEEFIETSQSLFETLHNKALIKKIVEIIEYVILVMRKKEEFYTSSQIKGLEFGLEVLKEGNTLFNTLTESDQELLIALITRMERDRLDHIS